MPDPSRKRWYPNPAGRYGGTKPLMRLFNRSSPAGLDELFRLSRSSSKV